MCSAYNSRLYTLLERLLLNTKESIYSLGGDRLYLHACKKIDKQLIPTLWMLSHYTVIHHNACHSYYYFNILY